MAQGKPRFYQPTITRLPSLIALFLLTLALIGLTELAVRRFPALDAKGIVQTIHEKQQRHEPRHILPRNAQPIPQAGVIELSLTFVLPPASNAGAVPASPETTPSPAAPQTSFLPDPNQQTSIQGVAPTSAFLPIDDQGADPLTEPMSTPAASAYLPIDDATTTAAYAPPSAYLPVSPGGDAVAGGAAPTAYLPVGPTEGAAPSAYLPVVPASSAAPSAYLPVGPASQGGGQPGNAAVEIRPATVNAAPTPGVVAAGSQAAGFQTPASQNVGGGQAQGSIQSAGSVQSAGSDQTPRPQTGEANGVTYSIGPSGAVVNGKTIDYATPTTATVASGKVVVVGPSGAVAIQDIPVQSLPTQARTGVTMREYLIGAFLPTVLAVLFSIPWYILFTAVQEMEPFYQLADPQGALARDSICLDYRAYVNVVATLKAGLRGHFVVLWAGVCSIAVLALAPLASETVFIGFVGEGRCTATSSRDACHPQLSVYPVAARAVQGILGLVAVLTICIAITIPRRKSGVYANPSSIAGIATLFQNPTLIDEFRQLDADGFDSRALEAQLQGNRYRLGHFQHRDGSMDYGIMRHTEASFYSDDTDPNAQYSRTDVPNKNRKYTTVSVTAVEAEPAQSRKPKPDYFLHPATVIAFAVFVAGLLTLVVYYNQTSGDTGFERFMDSQTFGVAFMFTAVGVMLKMYWGVVDDDLRATHPHRLLLLASSPSSVSPGARQSILASPPSNPFMGVVYSLRRMTWLPGWLSIVAVLTEPLIVALANIPFKPGTAYMAYRVSTYVTIGVLSLMLMGLFGVLGRQKVNGELMRRGTEAARERTVGRVMGLVCGSCMLSEFRGLAELDDKSRDEVVQGWGRGYRMGQLVGVDGVERWGVDEDIFVSAGGD
ncbi:MAG: hypothetical protein LQ346_004970 [Caloplaca aetnensis]|nr:MAG: hypothetical protein LQ346_004970 [Caloplaca aetnensis]